LSTFGQHNFQQPEFIERECKKKRERQIGLVAQGKHNFVTENPAKKRLMKLFEASELIHYIDIYDKTGEYHRQRPNKAWPSKKILSLAKRRKAITVAELKQKGVTPARLHPYITSAHKVVLTSLRASK
jgi:hypothetical protein